MLAKNKSGQYGQNVNGMKVNIALKEDPKPAFGKAITIPFILRSKVESEFKEWEL